MTFVRDLSWVNVPNQAPPPADAKMMMAEDFLRYENGIWKNQMDIATVAEAINTKADLVDGKVPAAQLPVGALVTDESVAAQVSAPATGAAIDARVGPVAASYIASEPAVVDAAAAAVDANPEVADLKARLLALDGQGQRGYSISQVAGRTVKVWDYLNSREQLIYGDTGVRALTVPAVAPLNGIGTITISRQNREVTMVLDNVEYVGTSTTEYLTAAGFIPVGFRPGYSENPSSVLTNVNANSTFPVAILQASRLRRMGPALMGNEPGLGTNAFRGTIKWKTDEAWPASLPGAAVGTIPYQ